MPNQKTYTETALDALRRDGRLWLAVHRESGRVDAVGASWSRLRWRFPLRTHRIDHVDYCGVTK